MIDKFDMKFIRSAVKNTLSVFVRFSNIDSLINISGCRLILPFYHTVSDENPVHIKHLYPIVCVRQFEEGLDFYQKHYSALSHTEILNTVRDKQAVNKNAFFLSFDDGLREFYDVAAPILLKRGIPATIFVNSAFVDNKDMFFRLKVSILMERIEQKGLSPGQKKAMTEVFAKNNLNYTSALDVLKITDKNKDLPDDIAPILDVDFSAYLSEKKPYLTTGQLKELAEKGFSIGSHSVSHPFYPNLSEDDQITQTVDCLHFLSKNLDVKDRLFAFPYTDTGVQQSFFERIKTEVDLSFGTAGLKIDPVDFHFQRIPMEMGDCCAKKIIKTEYLYFILKRLIGKHKISRH